MITHAIRARQLFAELAELDDSVFPLDRAAFAVALEEYPELDVDAYLRRLDTLAARAEVLVGEHRSPGKLMDSINEILYVQEGLRGNADDYYDPRNSHLNEVLDRKLGIPISLSVIYIEVARRMSFRVEGIGLPGHFIVKHSARDREYLIDPYNQGRVLTRENCQELLDRVYGGNVPVHPSYLQSMEKKAIISRMLFNLKGIYYQREEPIKALSVVERILLLNPGIPSEIRDRGLLFMQTSLFAKALADLEFYLSNTTAPQDIKNVEGHIRTLRAVVSSQN